MDLVSQSLERRARRAGNARRELAIKRLNTAGMVRVVMSDENGIEPVVAVPQVAGHRLGLSGVNHQCLAGAGIGQAPNVIVGKGGNRFDRQHRLLILAWV